MVGSWAWLWGVGFGRHAGDVPPGPAREDGEDVHAADAELPRPGRVGPSLRVELPESAPLGDVGLGEPGSAVFGSGGGITGRAVAAGIRPSSRQAGSDRPGGIRGAIPRPVDLARPDFCSRRASGVASPDSRWFGPGPTSPPRACVGATPKATQGHGDFRQQIFEFFPTALGEIGRDVTGEMGITYAMIVGMDPRHKRSIRLGRHGQSPCDRPRCSSRMRLPYGRRSAKGVVAPATPECLTSATERKSKNHS